MKLAELKSRVDDISDLATPPGVTAELLQILQSENVPIKDITSIIETDPALTIKILRVVNSPTYGIKGRVDTIQNALTLLGLNEVRTVLFHYTVFSKFFKTRQKQRDWMQRFWIHSVACAYVARSLAARFNIRTENKEFIAGLLHDVGKLALIEFIPAELDAVHRSMHKGRMVDIDAEFKNLGATHSMIGGWLAEKWHLPSSYMEAILYHHDPKKVNFNQQLVALINIAELGCIKMGFGFMEENYRTTLENCRGWVILEGTRPLMKTIDTTKLLESIKFELENQTEFAKLAVGTHLFH